MRHSIAKRGASSASAGALRAAIAAWAVTCLLAGGLAAQEEPPVFLIRLDGMINDAYAEAVKRKMNYAVEQGAQLIILELDTPGGTVQASQALGDFIFKDVEARVVAYINTKAYSGGTMVALACDEIYIDEAVGMMGDVAPITPAGQEVGEKFQAPIRATMLNYARDRYPQALVEAMVTKEIEVFRIHMVDDPDGQYRYVKGTDLELMPEEELARIDDKKRIVARGELLTLSARDAVQYGFARKAVSSRLALYDTLEVDARRVKRLYLTGSEMVLTFLDSFSPLLIAAGLILLFIEMQHPGFGLPGALGLAALATFFIVKYTLHYAHLLELLLFVAGVMLLLVEVFVLPGFGVVGGLGIALLFASVVLMLQQFNWPTTPSESVAFRLNLLQAVGTFLATALGLFLLVRFMGSVPILNRLIRRETMASATLGAPLKEGETALSEMIGQVGLALTPLRPAGRAEFGPRLLDVVTEGEFVEKGTRVQVVAVRGLTVVVRPHREA